MMTSVWMPKAIKDPKFKARLFPESEQTTRATTVREESEITKRRKRLLGSSYGQSTRLSGIQGQLKKRLGE